MPYTPQPVRILVNGEPLGCVEFCRVTEKRELLPVADYTTHRPAALACAGVYYEIEIKRAEPWRAGITSPDFRSLDGFELTVAHADSAYIYSGCRVSEYGEETGPAGACEYLKLAALRRQAAGI